VELNLYKHTCSFLIGWHIAIHQIIQLSYKLYGYIKRYYSSNVRIIPEAKQCYFCLETEKTTTMGKNHSVKAFIPSYRYQLRGDVLENCSTEVLVFDILYIWLFLPQTLPSYTASLEVGSSMILIEPCSCGDTIGKCASSESVILLDMYSSSGRSEVEEPFRTILYLAISIRRLHIILSGNLEIRPSSDICKVIIL